MNIERDAQKYQQLLEEIRTGRIIIYASSIAIAGIDSNTADQINDPHMLDELLAFRLNRI